jgi:hypothetical protein
LATESCLCLDVRSGSTYSSNREAGNRQPIRECFPWRIAPETPSGGPVVWASLYRRKAALEFVNSSQKFCHFRPFGRFLALEHRDIRLRFSFQRRTPKSAGQRELSTLEVSPPYYNDPRMSRILLDYKQILI